MRGKSPSFSLRVSPVQLVSVLNSNHTGLPVSRYFGKYINKSSLPYLYFLFNSPQSTMPDRIQLLRQSTRMAQQTLPCPSNGYFSAYEWFFALPWNSLFSTALRILGGLTDHFWTPTNYSNNWLFLTQIRKTQSLINCDFLFKRCLADFAYVKIVQPTYSKFIDIADRFSAFV